MIKFTLKESWLIRGRYYGYPDCCIQAFLELEHLSDPEPRKLDGTGYVPCKDCNAKSEEDLKHMIQSKRKALMPFPNENKEDESHLNSVVKELI